MTRTTESVVKNVGSFIVYSAFAVGAFLFAKFTTSFLLENVGIGLFLLHRFIAMLMFVFFLAINVGNMVVSFSTLYRSPEVNYLLTTPVSMLKIFLIKFLDNFFYSSGTLFFAGFAIMLGYGSYFKMPWYMYPYLVGVVMIPFMFLAACVAVVLLLLLMKLASKISFRMIVAIIALAYVAQVVFYFKITSPIHLANEVMSYYPYVDRYFGNLDPPVTRLLPSYWVSQILYFYLVGNTSAVIGYSALLLLSCAGAFIVVVLAGQRYFYSTWITSLNIRSLASGTRRRLFSLFSFETPSWLPLQIEAILKKEFWTFFREPSQWIHLGVLMGLMLMFLSSVGSLDFHIGDPMLRTIVYLVVFIFNSFLLASISLRFAYPMISLEGDAYWSVRSAPINIRKVYWIKWSLVLIMLLALGFLLAFLSNIPYRQVAIFGQVGIPSILIIVFALTSLSFGMGSFFANFNEKNPIRISSSQGATLSFLLSLLYLIVLILLYFFPVYSVFRARFLGLPPDTSYMIVALGLNLVCAIVITGLSQWIGLSALKRDF